MEVQPKNFKKWFSDLPRVFHDRGLIFWMKLLAGLKELSLLTNRKVKIGLPKLEVYQRDNESASDLADKKHQHLRE